jgi:nickel transport protein
MKRIILAAILLTALPFAKLWAHEVRATVDSSPAAVAIRVEYGDGEPFSYESYEIFPPAKTEEGPGSKDLNRRAEELPPYQTGRTDARGQILFLPDRPGTWTVRYMSDDGHGGETTVVVSPGRTASLRGVPLYLRFPALISGIGFFMGLGGALSLYRCYRQGKGKTA